MQCEGLTLEETPPWSGFTSPSGKYELFLVKSPFRTPNKTVRLWLLKKELSKKIIPRQLVYVCVIAYNDREFVKKFF